jgi:2-methylisocitrate lyase-like PEP mutase family enzyme
VWKNEKQIKKIGETFKGVPLATSVLERGGETPWLSPKEFGELGYSMILYPTTVFVSIHIRRSKGAWKFTERKANAERFFCYHERI